MGFRLTYPIAESKMYEGQVVTYRVSPLFRIPVNWVTEITHVDENKMFTDEQRSGPYSFWHHKHFFSEKEGGVEMVDIVSYKLPFGFLGIIANRLFVQKKLRKIFEHRARVVGEFF